MTQQSQSSVPNENRQSTSVRCPTSREPVVRLLIMAALIIGFGLWFLFDVVSGKYGPDDGFNYWFNVGGIVLLPIGLVPLGLAIQKSRQVLLADGEGIGYQGKVKVRWDQVTRLEVKGKGLLTVVYEDAGQQKDLELDAYKLQGFADLVQLVEAHTPGVPTEEKA